MPRYPGRVKLTAVEGQADTFDLVRADEPTQVGTPINKKTLLTDITASFLGLDPANDPTVDDAFMASVLAAKNACLVRVTVLMNGKPAAPNILINGISDLAGAAVVTNENGEADGLTTKPTTTISTPAFVDLSSVSKTISTPPKTIVYVTLTLSAPAAGMREFTSSATGIQFSPYVSSYDVCVCGGGGRGHYGYPNINGNSGGGGGAGGQVVNKLNIIPDPLKSYNAAVGGINGSSSFGDIAAFGGADAPSNTYKGAEGATKGGDGSRYGNSKLIRGTGGQSSSVRMFEDSTLPYLGGAGGGGGIITGSAMDGQYGLYPGSPNGGQGGNARGSSGIPEDGHNATGPGGGGGGGGTSNSNTAQGGDGCRGLVAIRWRLKV